MGLVVRSAGEDSLSKSLKIKSRKEGLCERGAVIGGVGLSHRKKREAFQGKRTLRQEGADGGGKRINGTGKTQHRR